MVQYPKSLPRQLLVGLSLEENAFRKSAKTEHKSLTGVQVPPASTVLVIVNPMLNDYEPGFSGIALSSVPFFSTSQPPSPVSSILLHLHPHPHHQQSN